MKVPLKAFLMGTRLRWVLIACFLRRVHPCLDHAAVEDPVLVQGFGHALALLGWSLLHRYSQ
ncbi:hypothetical protein TIFTF001_050332, partial [Ficus carica]